MLTFLYNIFSMIVSNEDFLLRVTFGVSGHADVTSASAVTGNSEAGVVEASGTLHEVCRLERLENDK